MAGRKSQDQLNHSMRGLSAVSVEAKLKTVRPKLDTKTAPPRAAEFWGPRFNCGRCQLCLLRWAHHSRVHPTDYFRVSSNPPPVGSGLVITRRIQQPVSAMSPLTLGRARPVTAVPTQSSKTFPESCGNGRRQSILLLPLRQYRQRERSLF